MKLDIGKIYSCFYWDEVLNSGKQLKFSILELGTKAITIQEVDTDKLFIIPLSGIDKRLTNLVVVEDRQQK